MARPWPTSDAAVRTSAPIGVRVTDASHESSKASENARFLIESAYPTPRRMSPGSVVRPVPPGRLRGSAASLASGMGIAASSSMTRTVGNEPSMTWPVVGFGSPVPRALRRRSSRGSMPRRAARRSICDSWPKHAWTAPNPRIAPAGGLFVRAPYPSTTTLSTRYGPTAKYAALAMTADVVDA